MDKQFYEHLLFEFQHGRTNPDNLLEVRHTVSDMDKIINEIYEVIKPDIFTVCEKKKSIKKTYSKTISGAFFKKYVIEAQLTYGQNSTYSCSFNPTKSFVGRKSNIQFVPHIKILLVSDNFVEFSHALLLNLGHELLHAYNYYKYFEKHGNPESFNDIIKYGLVRHDKAMVSPFNNERVVGVVLYRMSRKELNAVLQQLQSELIDNQPESIKDAKTAMKAVKKTDSYAIYTQMERLVLQIMGVKDKATQKEIMYFTNSTAGKEFTTYNQVKKFFWQLWFYWSKSFLAKASKIAYDVFEKYGDINIT